MNLLKETWNKEDIIELKKYLESKKDVYNNLERERKILNTDLPLLGINMPELRKIANEICKGNFIEFLEYKFWDYYDSIAIYGFILNNINDYDLKVKYLNIYSEKANNWALCDLLKFDIKGNEDKYLDLSKNYIKSSKPFKRRIGIIILFNYIKTEKEKQKYNLNYDKYIDEIFNILDKFKNEEHYYVNMVNAWILCELFINEREKTLKYLNKHNLNKFTINKAIQKCRDSFRVSKEDKNMLLKFKVKEKMNIDENEINRIVEILRNDGIVCVPTDTVYGLCAKIDSINAYNKLLNLKNREKNKPFAIMCANKEQIKSLAFINKDTELLIDNFMPGPITLILKKQEDLPEYITNGFDTIGIRMATSKELEEIILKLGIPIFMTSANLSNEDSYINIKDIKENLKDVDYILEGELKYKLGSTIVDCSNDEIKILRNGPITKQEIDEILNIK